MQDAANGKKRSSRAATLRRLNIYLEPEQIEDLKGLARQRRTYASSLVIEAVRFLLRNPTLFLPASSSQTVELQSHRKQQVKEDVA